MVSSSARTIRLVAPAGSGKTRTVVSRVRRRIDAGVPPDRILLLTFDRAAAASLRGSLGAGPSVPLVSTLNAYGNALLRERVPEEHGRVLSRRERTEILARVLERRGRDGGAVFAHTLDPSAWLGLLSRLKNEVFDPRARPGPRLTAFLERDPLGSAMVPRAEGARRIGSVVAVGRLYRGYDEDLRARGGMDFDDQKLRALLALLRSDRLRREVQGQWSEVVVDEFQDINRLDFELVRILAARSILVVAGDDDQAIYAFRGCSHVYLLELEERLDRATVSYDLRRNYRSPPNILKAADRLIRRNRTRIPKRPIAHRTRRAVVTLSPRADPEAEAASLAEAIERSGRPFADFAVLYRLHAQSLPLQLALMARRIPFTVRREDDLGSEDGIGRLRALGADPDLVGRLEVARRSREGVPPECGVSLRTIFRAKGLQWPVVHLVGCNDGVMPHRRSAVEDERRLFYVAMTRASEALHLSWIDAEEAGPPSRFLREAGLAGPLGWRLRRRSQRV
ncbi:MAG: ATP-dependent helicase [Gemmatimonadetes bacterium]|nr:ATP-dependent helicase [Gemmatimonadota bacterium]